VTQGFLVAFAGPLLNSVGQKVNRFEIVPGQSSVCFVTDEKHCELGGDFL
jgi:hypothetical protein